MLKNDDFWKKKLAAFLHDPPTKQFDIGGHETAAKKNMREAGFGTDEEIDAISKEVKQADIWDSALERFQFPKQKCAHDFLKDKLFIHPFSTSKVSFDGFNQSMLEECIQTGIYGVDADISWHDKFFLYWRRWLECASTSDKKRGKLAAYLPADSRIPDHSIWVHNSMCSAFAPCINEGKMEMEFLLFQFGPVQEFIAEARTTRDLFSGSYMLSWLIAHAMKAVSDAVGPDVMIFPSLRGNGIFDALHKDTVYSKNWSTKEGKKDTTWKRIREEKRDEKGDYLASWLLMPTLPNRFFAVVPKGRGKELAVAAENALRNELNSIATSVWTWLKNEGAKDEWKDRFFSQVKAFPQITWAVQGWLSREEALKQCEELNPDVAKNLRATLKFAEETIPEEDRDDRYYTKNKKRLNCEGVLWPAIYAILNAKLAARRNTRDFVSSFDETSKGCVKDSLSGKVDVIGSEEFWKKLKDNRFFSSGSSHRYGAMNIIKRLWCEVDAVDYLPTKLGLSADEVKKVLNLYKNVQWKVQRKNEKNGEEYDSYLAVLALDGDNMGKWLAGSQTPKLVDVLAPKAKEYVESLQGGKDLQRMISPSYHLQFSEALSNFAMYKANDIIKDYNGVLIYAGGDDVLAVVPAKKAFECARAVRNAFQTNTQDEKLFPGARTDMSCGIAFGHESAPLQMLVKEAQRMEHVAKTRYNRSSVAAVIRKRSGEIIEWGTKWDTNAIDLMNRLRDFSASEKISSRFAYALAGLLAPYDLGNNDLPGIEEVIREEVKYVVRQQGSGLSKEEKAILVMEIDDYLKSLQKKLFDPPEKGNRLADFIGLFLAETFINRTRDERGE